MASHCRAEATNRSLAVTRRGLAKVIASSSANGSLSEVKLDPSGLNACHQPGDCRRQRVRIVIDAIVPATERVDRGNRRRDTVGQFEDALR